MVISRLQHITYVDCCCWTSVKLSQVACMFDNHNRPINRTKRWGRTATKSLNGWVYLIGV